MCETKRFPLDFDALDKGSVVGPDVIREAYGIPPTSHLYSGKQVELAIRIERELKARGKRVTCRCDHFDILVLDDPGASRHNRRLFRKGVKRLHRAFRKLAEVDRGNLDEGQRKDHDRALVVNGAMLAGINEARREIQAIAYKRTTPGLPEPPTPEVAEPSG